MKEYDLLVIGTGSGLIIASAAMEKNPDWKVAIIDKDEAGGICLTRGCIPSKILLYSAEVVHLIQRAGEFGVRATFEGVDFPAVMNRMRSLIREDIVEIHKGLTETENVDFYPVPVEFIAPYTLMAGETTMTSRTIILCTGSKPGIPPVKGLQEAGYLTSDTLLELNSPPKHLVVIGGGYIAAEYGHFFASMGSQVTIIGRNPQFIPEEEPEISALASRLLSQRLVLLTNHEAIRVETTEDGKKKIIAQDKKNRLEKEIIADEILVATGRDPNTDILHPEKSGVQVEKGWIKVDEYLETTQPGIYALGDALGRYMFKHVANYEAEIVYQNAILHKKKPAEYPVVPHAVFTDPEIAAMGLREKEAVEKYGKDGILIGIHRYEETAKGLAIGAKEYFVKVILEQESHRILGAHLIGPDASVLIQEIINVMYTENPRASLVKGSMHIHPSLSEVVQRAFTSLMIPEQYHHLMADHYGISFE
ncbi:MAG: dihydrolipoyl dehydrogenase [Methanomicrobiales archaeon]|nr:dihydrolipoyl dehydrogenase [Methanomicrobiales archaeon]